MTDISEIDEVIRFIRRQCIDNGIGRWAVIDKRAGTFISWAGLKWVTEPMNGYDFYKVLLKSGFRLAGQFELDGAAHNWYEINRRHSCQPLEISAQTGAGIKGISALDGR